MTYRNRRFRGDWERHGECHSEWHGHGRGRSGRWGRRFGSREELISALERYQRNLEQRVADVAERVRHLRAEGTSEADSPEGSDATPTTHNV
jgi:hypothetical protein